MRCCTRWPRWRHGLLAVPLEYGDGSVQGLSLVSDGKDGFADFPS